MESQKPSSYQLYSESKKRAQREYYQRNRLKIIETNKKLKEINIENEKLLIIKNYLEGLINKI